MDPFVFLFANDILQRINLSQWSQLNQKFARVFQK